MGTNSLCASGVLTADCGDVTTRRLIALAIAAPAASVLGVAAYLEPSPAGLGTHSQLLNLPSCGWIAAMDIPCPTCGMTTAFSHVADGNLLAAVVTQPLGAVLAIATAVALVVGLAVAATGTRLATLLGGLWSARMAWGLAGFATVAWIYKILAYKGIL